MINELLRDHVTSVGFSLTLGKTHIAALVELDHMLKLNLGKRKIDYDIYVRGPRRSFPRAFANFVPGVNGLIRRGLAEHILPVEMQRPGVFVGDLPPRRVWRITKAGRLVINLLKETGLYQEYAAHLPPLPSTQAELKALRDQLNSYTNQEMQAYGEQVRAERTISRLRSLRSVS